VNLVDSLLEAISRLEGDALIMHVGEEPYVVTTSASMYAYRGPLAWGHVELSSRVLTTDAVAGMLEQLLPSDQLKALVEYGAIEYDLPHQASSDLFTVVAARGGDDVWLELRRTPASLGTMDPPEQVPSSAADVTESARPAFSWDVPESPAFEPAGPIAESSATESAISETQTISEPTVDEHESVATAPEAYAQDSAVTSPPPQEEPERPPVAETAAPEASTPIAEPIAMGANAVHETAFEIVEDEAQASPTDADVEALLTATASAILIGATPEASRPMPSNMQHDAGNEPAPLKSETIPEPRHEPRPAPEIEASAEPEAEQQVPGGPAKPVELATPVEPIEHHQPLVHEQAAAAESTSQPAAEIERTPGPARVRLSEPIKPAEEPRHGVVLPMARPTLASEPPVQIKPGAGTPLERILRIAAARGAATVYVVAQSQPVIRVDGEISVLDSEPSLSATDVERLVLELAPSRENEASLTEEWMADVPEVGRVRCVTFRDERGPGVIFRMTPPKAISADQLGIPPEVQALCAQPDGLVLVTGARASGKSTLLNAFVDLINRTRSDHIITVESQIGFVHENRRSFVSQREVKSPEAAAAAVRSAFREDPDVLVIDDIRTPEVVVAAFEAAEAGRLVFGSVAASSTIAALDRIIELFPIDRRAQAQTALADALRGVVAQMLLRRVRGGRIAAREILLNTPVVAGLILEGKTGQLPVALDSGRRHGMMPLADSFAALVREGTIHAAEAYRKTPDRAALLAALRADGVDTSFAERLA
jgi:twitching motility protein PilT